MGVAPKQANNTHAYYIHGLLYTTYNGMMLTTNEFSFQKHKNHCDITKYAHIHNKLQLCDNVYTSINTYTTMPEHKNHKLKKKIMLYSCYTLYVTP